VKLLSWASNLHSDIGFETLNSLKGRKEKKRDGWTDGRIKGQTDRQADRQADRF
jgi:hypothetical protein